jgi:type II secretory pathway pseudopilin PulG
MLEIVATIVLIGTAAPALLTAVRDTTARRASVQQQVVARWLACEKLEDIIADRHSTTRGWNYLITANYPDEPSVNGFPAFARTAAFIDTGPDLLTAGTGYRKVTVTVTYPDVREGTKSLSLSTIVTDYSQ